MVRTTRTSAAVKSSTKARSSVSCSSSGSGEGDNKGEASPPAQTETPLTTDKKGDSKGTFCLGGINLTNLRASVVLQKLHMDQVNPEPSAVKESASAVATPARKVARARSKSVGPTRSSRRSQQRVRTTTVVEKADSNDEGLVELIEIIDEDSKSHEGCSFISTEASYSMKPDGDSNEPKRSEIVNDNVSTDKGSKELGHMQVETEKKYDDDDASSSGSSGFPAHQEAEGESSSKTEVVGTRKSKRQVKVTNKYRDFVVDAPLPSSQVPYADVKLARSNPGGRKSHPKESEMLSSSDDLSPDSPPMLLHPPVRTYAGKREEKPRKRPTRACTPLPREGRPRKKKEQKSVAHRRSTEWADESITLTEPEDRNDSTLTFNIDSSYFTDDEMFGFDSPSPEEFCGWPEEEFTNIGAGPSCSSLSSLMSFSSILPMQVPEEDTSRVEEKSEVVVAGKKRRGRPAKSTILQPAIPTEEEPVRPAGSMFIKRSYKTTRSNAGTSTSVTSNESGSPELKPGEIPEEKTSEIPEVKPSEVPGVKPSKVPEVNPSEVPAKKPEPVEKKQTVVEAQPESMETTVNTLENEDGLDDAIEIVLQADEIINNDEEMATPVLSATPKPFRRRRIRGGTRPSPADGPRRGRSRRDTEPSLEEDTIEVIKCVEKKEEKDVEEQKVEVPAPGETVKEILPVPMEADTAVEPVVLELPKTVEIKQEEIVEQIVPEKKEEREQPVFVKAGEPEIDSDKTPKKSTSRDTRWKSISERRKSISSSRKSKADVTEKVVKEPETPKEVVEPSIVTVKVEPVVPETKDIVAKEPEKDKIAEEAPAEIKKELPLAESKPPQLDVAPKTPKEPKKSSKENRESRKDSKKSKDREREPSSKDRRDREPSRNRSSGSSKDRDKDKDKDRKRASESGKKERRSESERKPDPDKKRISEISEKKPDPDKKRLPEVSEKKPDPDKKRLSEVAEKKSTESEKKPTESEKKEDVTKPSTPVPKVADKPKKCFDSELKALDSTSKQKPVEEIKRSSKDHEKSRKSDKNSKIRSESEGKKKSSSSTGQSKVKEPKEKSRSTNCSPVPSKVGSSSAKKSKESSYKRDSSGSSKARKSLKDEKPKEEASKKDKSKDKPVEAPPLVDMKPPEVQQPKPTEVPVKEEPDTKPAIKEELPPPELPRIVTKASRKMYQNDEEIQITSSSQESLVSDQVAVVPKEETNVEEDEEAVRQISEAFDASVQISGPRPEDALKEFQNISISDEKPAEEVPKVEEELAILVVEAPASPPAAQELSNDDSNSNNSSTMDSMKEVKAEQQDDGSIRRSSRIKTISSQKQRTSGHGLVKDKDKLYKKTTISMGIDSKVLKDAITGNFNVVSITDSSGMEQQPPTELDPSVTNIELSEEYLRDMEDKLSRFETIRENMYHCDKVISKEAKKMTCDCFLTTEEIDRGELGCGEDCLNKLLMIECGSRCIVGERCTNKRFQKLEYANCQVFRTEKKGFGIQASTEIVPGDFIMEYVGEVLNSEQFDERAELYSKEKNQHYYFMALRSDAIIDATTQGNISRFINHSCDPNAETQKWTVNGELRIGFFCTKYVMPGEEITFDYQFQRYGRRAQKCYCEAENCTGWIGGDPGSDGESEYEDEEEVEESGDEEEVQPEVAQVIPVALEATEDAVKSEELKSLDEETKPQVEGEPDAPKPVAIEPAIVKPPEPKVPKKVRKRIERPNKRRPQIHEDPDLEQEINHLLKTGLKNQAQTLKLSRLMVRAKDIKSRSRLLTILQSGELPCRRLFLDYHGLQLLYGWICESTESIEDLKFRIQILDTMDRLPIPNKTMLKDSKIMQTIEKWAKIEKFKEKEKEPEKEKESSSSSPSDSNETASDSNTSSDAKKQEVVGSAEVLKNMPELLKIADLGRLKEIISNTCSEKEGSEKGQEKPIAAAIPEIIPSAVSLIGAIEIPEPEDENAPEEKRLGTQIRILSCKLLISWINLKEVFRIPKKERIEQMKEHEREADLRYKALGLGDDDESFKRHSTSRFLDRSRELKRRKSVDDRELLNFYKMKRPLSTASPMHKMDNLSKQQRRQMFEMKVAHEEAERRNKELWMQHESNCGKFGLNPHHTNPMDVPVKMNPATGEYFAVDDRPLPRPPSHMYFKVMPPPMPTNPEDYELPPMDLPPLWKFAIDERGRLYYYHVKERVPQWDPPKKNNPNRPSQGLRDEDISMSSDSSTTDTEDSEEEYLNAQLEQLLKKKKKQQSSFNLDDVLAKPDDMNDDLSKTIKDLEAGDSSPQASSSGEKLFGGESFEKTAEELLQHRKRKHSNRLVQEKVISPRTEEDKLYGQMEMKRYKETKEKLRRRKEEAKRLRARSMLDKSLSDSPFSGSFTGDALDRSATESSLIDDDLVVSHKIVDDKCIVDELDILTKKKKISPYEEWQKVKQRLGKKRAAKQGESSTFAGSSSVATSSSLGSSKIGKRKKADKPDLSSDEARKIKEKFRGEIAGVIVQHLSAYRKDSCQTGRITNTEDFKHLARKLTHFVLLKELKHCDNTINELEVTDSVRTKAREFIKKYMAKHGTMYVRGENEPDYANVNL
ncbi:probable histone-lysine N-methyltransferase CG1716 [Ochlerotatus camptorhynchus]|uniref:probable histone-lysine N-methyltransferase CG1716 n=1 Tax=Ochlerotatus camptorhynchus TaxID=644619 RepID=UPI0031DA8C57